MKNILALLALAILSGCASVADAGRLAEVDIISATAPSLNSVINRFIVILLQPN